MIPLANAVIETGVNYQPRRFMTSFGKRISPSGTLKLMEIGQSFWIDDPSMRSSLYSIARRLKIRVRTCKTDTGRLYIERTA